MSVFWAKLLTSEDSQQCIDPQPSLSLLRIPADGYSIALPRILCSDWPAQRFLVSFDRQDGTVRSCFTGTKGHQGAHLSLSAHFRCFLTLRSHWEQLERQTNQPEFICFFLDQHLFAFSYSAALDSMPWAARVRIKSGQL